MNFADFLALPPPPKAVTEVVKQTLPIGAGPRQGLPRELQRVEKFFVAFSGGKDSVACVLHLLDIGIPKDQIELWHYMMDPSDKPFMDWPITEDYCRKFAEAFDLPLLFAGRVGGFEQEMLRENAPAGDVFYTTITPKGKLEEHVLKGKDGKRVTKLAFPPPVTNLTARWCSSALKMEVGERILHNDPRIQQGTFCVVTGIRAEESAQRASQEPLEVESAMSRSVRPQDIRGKQRKRTVWTWLAVHDWPEADVWKIMKKYGVNPHPAYHIGFGRVSCMTCIFAERDQWATIKELNPKRFDRISYYEDLFGRKDMEARRVDRVYKKDADPDVVPQGERWKKGDPIPHGGAISIKNVGTEKKPIYLKVRQLVAGNYETKRGANAVYSPTYVEILANLANAVVQASTDEQRGHILDEARENVVNVEAFATLPKATIIEYKKQMLAAKPRGKGLAAYFPKNSFAAYFAAVETMREESVLVPPAKSYLKPGMARQARMSQSDRYTDNILVSPAKWVQPAGAFKHDGGPG